MNKNIYYLCMVLFFLLAFKGNAQQKIGKNLTVINPDAVLELESINKGFLLPRVALTSSTAVAPLTAHVAGMTVFNTATAGDVTPGYYYNDGSKWIKLGSGPSDATTTTNGIVRLAGDLSGTAVAPAVANLAINTAKLADNAVTSAKIVDGTIATADLSDGAITAAKLNAMSATSGQVLKYNGTVWAPAADAGLTTTTVSNVISSGALTTTVNGVAATAVTLPVADGSETKVNAGTNVTVTGAGTTLSPYVVNSAIETATQTLSTAIVGSATQVAVPSTNVQDALGDLAREVKTAGNNLYTSNGTLTENRTVTQGANTLGFTSTATTGTNHFNVDGSTFNVDAVNNRIGIGTFTPSQRLTVEGNIRIQSSQIINGTFGQLDFFNTAGFSTRPRAFISAYRDDNGDNGMLNFAVSPTTNAVPVVAMTIRETGNIGIGTTTPSTNFHTIGGVRFQGLAGTGSRMVVADANGLLSTTALPDGSETKVNAGTNVTVTGAGTTASPYVFSSESSIVTLTVASTTLTNSNSTVLCDVPTGGMTLILPSASSSLGKKLIIRKIDNDTDVLTFSPALNYSTSQTISTLSALKTYTIQSNGTGWWIISE
jgi:hypothetical protein